MTTNKEQSTSDRTDTILVYENNGTAQHCFCTHAKATERLNSVFAEGSGGSMFFNAGIDAEMLYAVSPDLRDRVEEAKRKLNFELTIRDAMNRYGVPTDRDLRIKIKKAIEDLRTTVLRPVF